jgi:flavin-dependent dehydrogenase
MKILKVAVIGGGVIGQYVSWKLSSLGHNVSVFDYRKEECLKDKACSVLVSERIKDFIPIDNSHIENIIDVCEINFPKKKIRLNFSPKHLALNKEKLMETFLDLNKKSGTKFFFEKNIKELPKGFDIIIGCDGANSIVRKSLGLKDPKMKMGAQWFLNEKDNSNITETFPGRNSFSWRIPKGERVECGSFGGNVKKKRMKGAMIPSPGFPLINAGLIFSNKENVVLCGDSMGLTKPWSGGGIIWNLYAADILIKNFPDFKKYKKEVIGFFGWKILKGKILNSMVYFLGRNFPYIIPSKIKYDNDFSVAFRLKK